MSKFGKYFLFVTGFALLATFARIPGTVINVHAHDRACSLASLKGTYAFRNTGIDRTVGGPVGEIGIAVFNGDGKRGLIRRSSSLNGVIQDWEDAPPPNGSYTIDPDCTGSLFNPDGVKTYNIVVLDGGKRFLLLDLEPDTIVTAEGIRLEEEKD
jgi:hypothetical protein